MIWSECSLRVLWIIVEECNDRFVPHLSASIEEAHTIAVKPDIVASKDPDCRLILIANRQACVQPVIDIRGPDKVTVSPEVFASSKLCLQVLPLKRSLDINFDVREVGIHHGGDVVCRIAESDLSILSTLVDGIENAGHGIAAVGGLLNIADIRSRRQCRC